MFFIDCCSLPTVDITSKSTICRASHNLSHKTKQKIRDLTCNDISE